MGLVFALLDGSNVQVYDMLVILVILVILVVLVVLVILVILGLWSFHRDISVCVWHILYTFPDMVRDIIYGNCDTCGVCGSRGHVG